ncbi:hypothetical protein L6452_15385 [Arctium lappa]|uniref:Uncharacterized protein n=1 Tax=Arctium lappa TaxID=4217 RepID=A0ACB9CNK1_ARCLA|nr:hypothetical protein L6452_15385 [Arctium lappa]
MPFAGVQPPQPPYPRPTQGTGVATGVTTFSIPTIPTMPPPTTGYPSMYVADMSASINVSLPPNIYFNLDDLVAQRLKQLEEQNEKMMFLLAKLPGAIVPVDDEPQTGFQASAFIDEITMIDVPKKYNISTFTPKYSGINIKSSVVPADVDCVDIPSVSRVLHMQELWCDPHWCCTSMVD